MHQISDANRHHDWLIRSDPPQRSPVEMIKVRMGDENEIDLRQMMDFEPRSLQALNHLEPLRPVWIDQYIDLVGLNQKRSVANPGNANLAFLEFREYRRRIITGPL